VSTGDSERSSERGDDVFCFHGFVLLIVVGG
jgi:hypothetical protein